MKAVTIPPLADKLDLGFDPNYVAALRQSTLGPDRQMWRLESPDSPTGRILEWARGCGKAAFRTASEHKDHWVYLFQAKALRDLLDTLAEARE